MSLSIDLTTHGKQLQQVYDKIISGSPDTSWAVFSYDKGASNELKVQSQGGGELDEIVDEFSDGRVSYGFVRVEDPNTRLNKFVLIGWCGEGVPEHKKGLFHSHFLAVAKFLKGYHVQITARSEADLDPATIMKKVADSSGSKYSEIMSKFETSPYSKRGPPISPSVSAAFGRSSSYSIKKDDDGWGDAPQISSREPVSVKSAYQPTKVDMAALRAQKSDTTSGDRPEVVKGSYVPIGKVDIAAIRAQAQQQQPSSTSTPSSKPEPVGTTGYTPIQLPKPKPLGSGPGVTKFGPRVTNTGGTIAPMPVAPVRESKVIGGASKNFGTDASGKTPSQLWAERKARERGVSGSMSVVPDIAPQSPLPTGAGSRGGTSPTMPRGGYVEDSAEVIGKPVSGGVAAMRERFARQSLEEDRPPISPGGGVRPAGRFSSREQEEEEERAPVPPPVAMASKPSPGRSFQSLDHVVAAGAGAGAAGLGMGVLAMQREKREEPQEEEEEPHYEPEQEEEEEDHAPPPLPAGRPAVAQDTWDTSRDVEPTEEEEEYIAARQRSQIHAEQEHEPEEEEEPQYHAAEHEDEEPSHTTAETGAQSSKTAVVLFDYEAQEENELSLTEGQIITNVEFIDDGWWAGEDSNGNNGLFPSNYVELQESQHPSDIPAVPLSHSHDDVSAPATHHEEPAAAAAADDGETAVAEYDYEAQEENELSFPEGAVITNIERVDDNWWAGEYQGHSGLFPSNYVRAE